MTWSPLLTLCACQYPAGLLDGLNPGTTLSTGTMLPGPADRSRAALAAFRRAQPTPTPLVMLGDQIYADATAGLFDPRARDSPVEAAYQTRKRNRFWEQIAPGPTIALFDDHEVTDNWEPSANMARNAQLESEMVDARALFEAFQAIGDPRQPLWMSAGAFIGRPLFIGDTRTEREFRSPLRMATAQIMSAAQRDALDTFLRDPAPAPGVKFVATSSILLPRRLATRDNADETHYPGSLTSDAWDGYPASLHALLATIAEHAQGHCVFLSGDEHMGLFAQATVRGDHWNADRPSVRLHSVHVGALYAPYPFANSEPADFAGTESFRFVVDIGDGGPRGYECSVETAFPLADDGFAAISVQATDGACEEMKVSYFSGDPDRLERRTGQRGPFDFAISVPGG